MVMDTAQPRVAVIGAGGFVGQHVTRAFRRAYVPTAAFTRATPLFSGGRLVAAAGEAEVIVYLATSVNPALAERYPERVAADRAAFAGLLEGLRRSGRRPSLIFASSAGAVYDPSNAPPYRESDPTRPASAYGRAKLELERILLAARDVVRPVVIRIANAYGPGQRTGTMQGVIGHWLEAAAAGEPLRLYGEPGARRDYVFVDDVAAAVLHASRLPVETAGIATPEIFNIASGEAVSLADLARLVEAAVGRALPVEYLPARQFDRRDVWFEISRARQILRWHPRVTLADGIARTWQRQARAEHISPLAARSGPHRSSP